MKKKTTIKKTRKRPRKYPGIVRRAAVLGVSRQHLFRVLEGERASAPLLKRYKDLLRKETQHD